MKYLVLSVIFTCLIFLILKEFNRFKVDNFQAIVINYFVAFVIGSVFTNMPITVSPYVSESWTIGALVISFIFIIVFNLMAVTAQKGGLSVMTIANKMSVVIPILIGVVLYQESLGWLKIVGITIALLGVWFTSKKKGIAKFDKSLWYLPFLIFIGSGIADSVLNHMQTFLVPQDQLATFSTSLFLFCGLLGIMAYVVKYAMGNLSFSLKSSLAGVVLGVPNYFSIYFLLKALSQPEYETSLIFSVNNLLVVLVSVVLGVVLYQEKLSKQNYIGIGMSVLAITLLYFAI